MKHSQTGFSVVELMISVSLGVIISAIMVAIILAFYGNTVRSQAEAQLAVDTHFALREMVEDVRFGSSIGATNQITDANEPSGGWSTSSSGDIIIVNRPATRDDESIIYNDSTGEPYQNEIIYFVDNGKLMRRTLANSAATDNSATTSCPEAAASSSCPRDNELAEYVTDFSFTMYDTNHQVTTDPALARAVRLSMTSERTIFGENATISNAITTGMRN